MVEALWIRRQRKSALWDRRQRLGEVVDLNASLRGTPSSGAERPAELVLTVPRAGLATRSLLPAQAHAEPAAIGEVLVGRPVGPCEPEAPTTLSATDEEDARWLLRQLRDGTLTNLQQVREPTKAELAQASAEIECERYLRDPRPIPIRPAGWVARATHFHASPSRPALPPLLHLSRSRSCAPTPRAILLIPGLSPLPS